MSLEWLWISCASAEFTFSEALLGGNFSASQFLISKMKIMISPFDAFCYIKSKWIWFFKCVLYTIISMIVIKMKYILHNRCCQLLCVVSSKRIFILFPSCSIFSFWTDLNKNVFLKNTNIGAGTLAQGICPTHRHMIYTVVWKCGKLFYNEIFFLPNC